MWSDDEDGIPVQGMIMITSCDDVMIMWYGSREKNGDLTSLKAYDGNADEFGLGATVGLVEVFEWRRAIRYGQRVAWLISVKKRT